MEILSLVGLFYKSMNNDIKKYTKNNFINSDDTDISYGFFTRIGGVSTGIYKGLNCGTGSNDLPDNIIRNRYLVAKEIGVGSSNLLSTYQVHGSKVINVKKAWSERPQGDAMVTDKSGIALGILTADCTPVLFVGKKESGCAVVGVAHAGWKGAVHGVLENTISGIISLGAQKQTIKACVGPCIGRNYYEVSEDFIEPFIKHNKESERFFYESSNMGHLMFDIGGYCVWRIAIKGVKNISILDKDTYSNEDEFYSYRRSIHKGECDYGRQISVIAIR